MSRKSGVKREASLVKREGGDQTVSEQITSGYSPVQTDLCSYLSPLASRFTNDEIQAARGS